MVYFFILLNCSTVNVDSTRGRAHRAGGPFPVIDRYIQHLGSRLADNFIVVIGIMLILAVLMLIALLPPSVVYLEYDKVLFFQYIGNKYYKVEIL